MICDRPIRTEKYGSLPSETKLPLQEEEQSETHAQTEQSGNGMSSVGELFLPCGEM